jgi:hypothetical protein
LYSTLTQPPLSTHFWYSFRRQEITEQRGGGDLPAVDSRAREKRDLERKCRENIDI